MSRFSSQIACEIISGGLYSSLFYEGVISNGLLDVLDWNIEGYMDSATFLELTDSIAAQAFAISSIVPSLNVGEGTYEYISSTLNPMMESSALLKACNIYDSSINRDGLLGGISQWRDFIRGLQASLVDVGISSIDDYCAANSIRVSPWFAIVCNALMNLQLQSISVFPEDPNTLGNPVVLGTINGVGSGISWVPNSNYLSGSIVRVGIGNGYFAEFNSEISTQYNAGPALFGIQKISGNVNIVPFVVQIVATNIEGSLETELVTLPVSMANGSIVSFPYDSYLSISSITYVSGNSSDLVANVIAPSDRLISVL